jgi:Secretion system C-terminal sorting domain
VTLFINSSGMKNLFLIFFAAVNLLTAAAFAVTPNQVDNFQDGTTQHWTSGSFSPNPPVVLSGGFGGASDKFLRVTSTGTLTAGGKLVVFDTVQWSGNYINANIVSISMRVRNSGSGLLLLRLGFLGPAGWFVSLNPISLPSDGVWKLISFPILPVDLTGTGNAGTTLSAATTLRILHNSAATYFGEPVVGQLDVDEITAVALTGVDGDNQNLIPHEYSLEQNYPNPFNPGTIIKYSLPFESSVSLSVYNLLGRSVKELVAEIQPSGEHILNFNAEGLSSGLYFYSIHAVSINNKTNFNYTRKMILLK